MFDNDFNKNFDRDFNNMNRLFKVFFGIAVTLIVCGVIFMICSVGYICHKVNKDGLKSLIEPVWNGSNTNK